MDPFKFEDNLANACFAGLTARGIPHGSLRANTETAQERVECTATGFQRASGQMTRSNSAVWFHNHYAGQIAFAVITQVGGDNAANHNVWVSNVRSMMDRSTQFFTSNNLPCYEILKVAETASDPDEEKRTDTHHTKLTYSIELGILGGHVA